MALTDRKHEDIESEKSFDETDPLRDGSIDEPLRFRHRDQRWQKWIVAGLSLLVVVQTFVIVSMAVTRVADPSLDMWSPANEIIRYVNIRHDGEDKSPYVASDPPLIDELWMELYDFGTIGITPSENAKLVESSTPTPKDPDTFPVMIQVFHNIHCLNLIRKAVWRDYYPDAMDMLSDGTVNRTSPKALHIDHCINALRESLMCSSDVTPITFHPVGIDDPHVFPNLAATHTCRDFDAIKKWAEGRQIDSWKLDLNETLIAENKAASAKLMASVGHSHHMSP